MLEDTASLEELELDRDLELATLDAAWHRCRREARTLAVLELAQTSLAIAVLVVVALCGIVAITRTAVATGAVALPLGLGLALTIALTLFGLAFRVRMSHDVVSQDIFKLECARHTARERAKLEGSAHPYRVSVPAPGVLCTRCFDARLL